MLQGEVTTIANALKESSQAFQASKQRVIELEAAIAKEISSYEHQLETVRAELKQSKMEQSLGGDTAGGKPVVEHPRMMEKFQDLMEEVASRCSIMPF